MRTVGQVGFSEGVRGATAEWERRVGMVRGREVGRGAGVVVRRGAGGVACSSLAAHLLAGKRSLAAGREPLETLAP